MHKVINGDSLEVLKEIESNSVDSCVTDPPYELGFMGKRWDSTGIAYNVALWQEVYRVLKPGAHLLAFGGTRTYHRMACAIEDAGFEIRDQMQWLYGSGFPKSHDISKAIDKQAGAEREDAIKGGHMAGAGRSHSQDIANTKALVYEKTIPSVINKGALTRGTPATPAAIQWQGWGTALKPANEPICVARKPFNCTVAENVLQWGTGAINVDAGRIEHNEFCRTLSAQTDVDSMTGGGKYQQAGRRVDTLELKPSGRWPANVLLDEEAAKMLDEQSGELTSGARVGSEIDYSNGGPNVYGKYKKTGSCEASSGGASRFFYVAKASKSEREAGLEGFELGEPPASARSKPAEGRKNALGEPRANHHPTVKPIKLMEYLVKLVTPPNGIVLDPFTGSGTTGCACARLGFGFIGIEKESKYKDIAEARIKHFACDLA